MNQSSYSQGSSFAQSNVPVGIAGSQAAIPPIPSVIKQLDACISDLANAVVDLVSRLQLVSTPVPLSADKDGGAKDGPSYSWTYRHLDEQRLRVIDLTNQLRSATGHLEV